MSERRRRRRRRVMIGVAVATALALALLALNTGGHYSGLTVARVEPEALAESLRPYYRIAHPPGAGPFPVALLFSGCDGPRDNLDRWAAALQEHGWATMIVDSHAPRGLDEGEVWRLVCAGQVLMGSERAGDILVAMDDARHLPFANPDRLLLVGASHGGWSIMDLLALDPPAALPHNLVRPPASAPADPLAGLAGVILLYPYCGPASLARKDGWRRPVPTLMILAGNDHVAPPGACRTIAETLAARGLPVTSTTLPGIDHGFDQSERSALSPLAYDPAATARALSLADSFLARLP